MNEYIKKSDIKKAFLKGFTDRKKYPEFVNWIAKEAERIVGDMPSADVQPVKHGYWEEIIGYGGWGDTHYRCSVCGEEWYLKDGKPKDNNMNFCPRCSAKMIKE